MNNLNLTQLIIDFFQNKTNNQSEATQLIEKVDHILTIRPHLIQIL